MARHAATAPAALDYRIPAHYLTPDTRDYPLVLLVEDFGGVGDQGLPVAHGVTLLADARYPDRARRAWAGVQGSECEACGMRVGQDDGCGVEAGGEGDPAWVEGYHLACLLAGDHYGLVPSHAVEFVGVE